MAEGHLSLRLDDGPLMGPVAIIHPVPGAPAGGSVRPSPARRHPRQAMGRPSRPRARPLTCAMAINQPEREIINQLDSQHRGAPRRAGTCRPRAYESTKRAPPVPGITRRSPSHPSQSQSGRHVVDAARCLAETGNMWEAPESRAFAS